MLLVSAFRLSIVLLCVAGCSCFSIHSVRLPTRLKTRHVDLTHSNKRVHGNEQWRLYNDESNVAQVKESEAGALFASMGVGVITAVMGFLYGKVLGASVKSLWTRLPLALDQRGVTIRPRYFITSTCTLGGLLMGILSSKLSKIFTVADFVSAFSAATKKLPSSRANLLPLLLLSLVTSTFGFSVGPEAPMVCAGALVGASLSKQWSMPQHHDLLAYAGAAGALTAFMGIPIAGSIFALELTRRSAGVSSVKDISPVIAASVAAIFVIQALLLPHQSVGGHFDYGTVGAVSGRSLIFMALGSSVVGALLGTIFHKSVTIMKRVMWPTNKTNIDEKPWKRQVLVKTAIGLVVGLLSSSYPQTMFWGEGSLQCMIDGQKTPFSATKHGLPLMLTGSARVNPNLPFSGSGAALQVASVKLLAIALACAGKFPGGIIFPLFYASAAFAHVMVPVSPIVVMCLMAATQASVTRTPLATVSILSLLASPSTELSVFLPACLVASYGGVWISQLLSRDTYFQYSSNE